MGITLRRTLIIATYFFLWGFFYFVLYQLKGGESAILLEHFRRAYAFESIMISFIRALPALEIVAILVLFTVSASSLSRNQLKKHSPSMTRLLSKLFVACLITSAINMTMSELVRPSLIYSRNRQSLLSQKYYESINEYSVAVANKDYERADEVLKTALSIWDESPEVLSLQGQLASMKDVKNHAEDSAELLPYSVAIPEHLSAKEIYKIAKERAKILDFYTAYHYCTLVLKLAKEDEELKAEAGLFKQFCMNKISAGHSLDELMQAEKQFEAKKLGYDALTQKNYRRAYYAFLDIHNEILKATNKYDPDVEKYLNIAQSNLLEEVFFIEEVENIASFNSGYNIKFKKKDSGEHFTIGNFYFSSKKDSFSIYISNLKYSKIDENGVILSKATFPYAKIIGKDVDGEQKLYMLVEATSKYSKDRVIPSNEALLGLDKGDFPIDLDMSLEDFSLIVLAQQEPHAMTIIDLYNFVPIASKYGFDSYVYRAELCTRFADFFLFIISTVLVSILAFKLKFRTTEGNAWLLLSSAIFFPFIMFMFVDVVRHLFKVFVTLVIRTNIVFPCGIILILLFLMFVATTSMFYNVGEA